MLAIIGIILGAALGAYRARKLGGGKPDMAQYAVGFGLIGGLIGLAVSLVLYRFIA